MQKMIRNAILRRPAANFAAGLTTVSLGKPDLVKVNQQYESYCQALTRCRVALSILEADPAHPDSTFVEDTAVLTKGKAVLTRPGAESRQGEVNSIRESLAQFFSSFAEIKAPGTVDGGDICEAEKHFFIGLSQRTNEEGARQLGEILAREGYSSSIVDIRTMHNILHLKSGIAYLGSNRLVVMEEMASRKEFAGYDLIPVNAEESYAANCVLLNDDVLIPSGYPALQSELERRGYSAIPLQMSEFQKMDGGLSCLSLRF
jgi:dimethylargininase